jgi:hypothetical protein
VKVEFSRFKVQQGKSERVDKWLEMLNENMEEVVQILDREEMKLEVIFREIIDGEEYLYWFSVQGEHGGMADTSPFEVDKNHLEFHEECIDHSYGMRNAQAQVIMVPKPVAAAMSWMDPPGDKVQFQKKELIYKRPD